MIHDDIGYPIGTVEHWTALDCVLDGWDPATLRHGQRTPDADRMVATAERIQMNRLDLEDDPQGQHGLDADRMRALRRPMPPGGSGAGVTLTDLAARLGLRRATLIGLMEHHGYIELAPFGRSQSRYLLNDVALRAGIGRNVDGSGNHVAHLEGFGKASPFVIVCDEWVDAIVWTFDLDGIASTTATMAIKRERQAWLLEHHDYLGSPEIAARAGSTQRAVEKARRSKRTKGSYGWPLSVPWVGESSVVSSK